MINSNNESIADILKSIDEGKTQLPDFQRGWVWEDGRIRALIASISNGYPIGAAMFLQTGGDDILKKPDLLPDSGLSDAASYFNNEWEAVVDIFKRGDTALDNNLVERMNRYFSMSRRSSLFFGSHKGAERAAVLYTLALSAKMNHLNFFDYLTDILDRTAQWQPNVPLENYRNLLPDRWQPSTKE